MTHMQCSHCDLDIENSDKKCSNISSTRNNGSI